MPKPKRKSKQKLGRPSKFADISLTDVEKLAGYGLTDQQLADVLHICKSSLNNYKQNPKFLDSLKKGKQKSDNYVIGSLFHRAIGYSHPEAQLFCYKGRIIKTTVMKHYPPEVTAMIFWLKNRKPEDWRDRQEVAHLQKSLPEEEVRRRIARLEKRIQTKLSR